MQFLEPTFLFEKILFFFSFDQLSFIDSEGLALFNEIFLYDYDVSFLRLFELKESLMFLLM